MRDFPPLYSAILRALAEALIPVATAQHTDLHSLDRTARGSLDSPPGKYIPTTRTLNTSGLRSL